MSYVCLCREGIAVVQKDNAPTENKLVCTGNVQKDNAPTENKLVCTGK